MNEKIINVSMELIATSGNAKSLGLSAINMAKEGDFEKSKETLKEAKLELNKVHKIHAELISDEAGGEKLDISLLFIHSQDHLTSAIIILDLAEHLINLYSLNN
ncbi:PTS lactose/cellobiose transporter subunit IIA [Spiroplasma diminutum]|uniref:PTS system cellobiose-specific IIA component n=1 Tax=Spiroplasma diminutum CUAS-1 TaxID=1276221 RepID=S5M2B5_9MOLU|nr:PTS lactose/cellobiose transporter subunit IIA [Spiroplasma diminutum]AGR42202.1 PTS system cellobiose-specific IIA component [Spiroplasma diminutum CUAS-1]